MKWVIRIVGFLVTAAVLTLLRSAQLPVAAVGIITAAVFYLGIFFIPDRIIRAAEAKRAHDAPSVPDAPAPDAPEEICAYPMMKQASAALEAPASPPPKEEKAAEHRPLRPYNSGYVLVILCLVVLLALSIFTKSPAEKELENEYRTSLEEMEAQKDAEYSEGYDAGYAAGYTDGFEHCESGGILLPSQRD